MGNRLTANNRVTKVRLEPVEGTVSGVHTGSDSAEAASSVRVSIDTRADSQAVEEPLQIRVNGENFTTTMRTPGNDFELVHGLLHAEDVIHSRDDVVTMRYCAGAVGPGGQNTYNTIDVELRRSTKLSQGSELGELGAFSDPNELDPFREFSDVDNLSELNKSNESRISSPLPLLDAPMLKANSQLPARNIMTTSACGICGTTSIDDLVKRRRYPIRPVRPEAEFVVGLPGKIYSSQKAFRRTGGIHAAGVVSSDGEVLLVREDVGRHNAADKVIGALLMEDQLPAEGLYLVMTSRASFELVQKAVLAGFSGLVAVSAATSLAVDLAKETGLFLTGFTRENRFNLYSGSLANISK